MKPYIIPIFIPHMGCPHHCIYCNQSTITGIRGFSLNKIKETIDFFLTRKIHAKRNKPQIAFYGGSFTALEPFQRKALLSLAFHYIQKQKVESIRLSTRPDAINEEILNELKSYSVKTIELGVQSLDENVLNIAQRGHSVKDVFKATTMIKEAGFSIGWQLMIGLPSETEKTWQMMINEVINWHPDFVRIYPTIVLKNTVLARWWKEGRYKPLTLKKAVEICKKLVMAFEDAGISVIRLGLQPTSSLIKNIIAGPWHPSFGEMVRAAIFREKIITILKKQFKNNTKINIFVSPKIISQCLGQKKENYYYLKQIFPEKRIAILPDLSLKKEEIKIVAYNSGG